MIAKLLPVLFLVAGTAAGIGVGKFLNGKPGTDSEPGNTDAAYSEDADQKDPKKAAGDDGYEEGTGTEFVKMNNQFVVPLVSGERVSGLVVMSLSLEVPAEYADAFYEREPKLRDAFLGVLFDHANIGGFSGTFTTANNLDILRTSLRETARLMLGEDVQDVLILDLARQDV